MFSKYRLLIFSENPDKLARFYEEVLEFKLENKLDIPNDYGYMFVINGDFKVWVGRHSEIHGPAKEPFRHINNLYTEEVNKWYLKIKSHPGVEIILPPTETPFSKPDDVWHCCTFLDPEKNCWQFMGRLGS